MPSMHEVALVGSSRNSCAGHPEFFKDGRISSGNCTAQPIMWYPSYRRPATLVLANVHGAKRDGAQRPAYVDEDA
jgi:hypothetical protein